MKFGVERLDLFHQAVDQFFAAANRNAGNVVDRLVRVELGTLTAGNPHRVEDVRIDSEQAEFENLENTYGPGSDDESIRFNDSF